MQIDKTLSFHTLILAIAACLFPVLADIRIPLMGGRLVFWIETGQAFWLLFGAVFTFCYVKPLSLPEGSRQFWLWAVLWWITLFGRSTNWGREFIPDAPKLVLRITAILLIGALVIMPLVSRFLRKEIMHKLRNEPIPIWTVILVILTYLISDTVEHHRLLAHWFLHDRRYQDLMEELYEFPFMIGLLCISFGMMKHEATHVKSK